MKRKSNVLFLKCSSRTSPEPKQREEGEEKRNRRGGETCGGGYEYVHDPESELPWLEHNKAKAV